MIVSAASICSVLVTFHFILTILTSFHPHHNLMREDSIFAPILQMRTLRHRRDEDLLTLPQLGVNKQVLPMFNLSPHLPWF